MTLAKQRISSDNSTLNQLLMELQEECQNVISVVHQLQLSELSDASGERSYRQKGKILSELLVSSIHLHSHCDEDWQNLISDELETLADDKGVWRAIAIWLCFGSAISQTPDSDRIISYAFLSKSIDTVLTMFLLHLLLIVSINAFLKTKT